MYSISRTNVIGLLLAIVATLGLGIYLYYQERPTASDDPSTTGAMCLADCGFIVVNITGVDTSGSSIIGGVTIKNSTGTTIDTIGSNNTLYENKTSLRYGPFDPGSGYTAQLSIVNGSRYQLDTAAADNNNPRSVTVSANSDVTIQFALKEKDGTLSVLSRIDGGPKNSEGKLADVTVTGPGGTFTGTLPIQEHSGTSSPSWTMAPGDYTVELKNIHSGYRLTNNGINANPKATIVHANGGQSVDFWFEKVSSSTSSSSDEGTGGGTNETSDSSNTASPDQSGQSQQSQPTGEQKTPASTQKKVATSKMTNDKAAQAPSSGSESSVNSSPSGEASASEKPRGTVTPLDYQPIETRSTSIRNLLWLFVLLMTLLLLGILYFWKRKKQQT